MTYTITYTVLTDGNTVTITSEPLKYHAATTLLERIEFSKNLAFVSMKAGE